MTSEPPARFVRLTKVGTPLKAQILAARLTAEGIETRVHSAAYGPYPMTVGDMAEAEIWVLSDRVADASQIMLDTEVNDALGPVEWSLDPDDAEPLPDESWQPWEKALAAAVAAVIVAMWLARAITVY